MSKQRETKAVERVLGTSFYSIKEDAKINPVVMGKLSIVGISTFVLSFIMELHIHLYPLSM